MVSVLPPVDGGQPILKKQTGTLARLLSNLLMLMAAVKCSYFTVKNVARPRAFTPDSSIVLEKKTNHATSASLIYLPSKHTPLKEKGPSLVQP